jgi:hypothetical protein
MLSFCFIINFQTMALADGEYTDDTHRFVGAVASSGDRPENVVADWVWTASFVSGDCISDFRNLYAKGIVLACVVGR